MKLLLDNVSSKHFEWLREMSKALNFTITEIELSKEDSVESEKLEEPETSYLLSSQANKKHLEESIEQSKNKTTASVDINNLWK